MKKFLLVLFPFFLTGCVHYVELNQLDVVDSLGIDYQNNLFVLTATTVEKKDEQYSYQVLTSTGATIQEAVENIKIQENKKLYIAHLNLLVLTPRAVNQKLEEIIEYFLENTESRNDFSLALSESIDFLKINEQQNLQESIQIIEEDLGTTKSIQFEDFLKDLLEQNISYLPTIETENEVTVHSITLIENYQTSFHLSKEECILYNFLKNNIQKTAFEENIVLSSETFIRFKNQKINIAIRATLAKENDDFANQLERKIKEMFEKYKEQKIDIFNFQKILKVANYSLSQTNQTDLLDQVSLSFSIHSEVYKNENKEVLWP